jgi:hypothetical protein
MKPARSAARLHLSADDLLLETFNRLQEHFPKCPNLTLIPAARYNWPETKARGYFQFTLPTILKPSERYWLIARGTFNTHPAAPTWNMTSILVMHAIPSTWTSNEVRHFLTNTSPLKNAMLVSVGSGIGIPAEDPCPWLIQAKQAGRDVAELLETFWGSFTQEIRVPHLMADVTPADCAQPRLYDPKLPRLLAQNLLQAMDDAP